ncbi:MAG: site-specific integrase [Gammaproteobacteria bacterium]|nr:site-specific integrase [Gammaproteobacteria bacterium]
MEHDTLHEKPPTLLGPLADSVIRSHSRLWKPRTLAVNRCYLRNQILPFFARRPVADVSRGEVRRWFAGLRATPAAANRALPVLSTVFREAERLGFRPENSNPCAGIRRYRTPGRSRFLTPAEIRRIGAVLAERERDAPDTVALVRLLILTGCRQGEIRHLRWHDYREGNLYLPDSKTGPRTVWLSGASRRVLAGLGRRSAWVFPARRSDGPMRTETLYRRWRGICQAADLQDMRLHDLRHTYASFALSRGETVPTIGRLLGHRDAATTLRYLHFDDTRAMLAVQTVAAAMAHGP